jgi:hypothetical protein
MTRSQRLSALAIAPLLICAACERQTVNPPTEPAQAVTAPGSDVPPATPPPGVGSVLPGSGPATFVGRWAARIGWCANTSGAEQPVTISTLRFEGYENRCALSALAQVPDGYEADLACQAEGAQTQERIRMSVQGDAMRLTWLNRDNAVVQLVRCPSAPEPTG